MATDITIADITNQSIPLGAFEELMSAVEARLDAQFDSGRISGAEYATVYLGAMQSVMQQAVAYVLQEPKVEAEVDLLNQKRYTEEAQILDVVNSATVLGTVGKQKALYTAQTDGFARDAEQKVLKTLLDTWNIQRTTDDTLTPPTGLADSSLNDVITKAKDGIDIT